MIAGDCSASSSTSTVGVTGRASVSYSTISERVCTSYSDGSSGVSRGVTSTKPGSPSTPITIFITSSSSIRLTIRSDRRLSAAS